MEVGSTMIRNVAAWKTDTDQKSYLGHLCLSLGAEWKVEVSPVHVFVPNSPQLLALKKM